MGGGGGMAEEPRAMNGLAPSVAGRRGSIYSESKLINNELGKGSAPAGVQKDAAWQKQGGDCRQWSSATGEATGPSGRLTDSARTMTQTAVATTERGKGETV